MCSTAELPCPLCDYPIFSSVESLRINLVNVTNRQLSCPVCNEIVFGLDKLTIHLFSHTILADNRTDEPTTTPSNAMDSSNSPLTINVKREIEQTIPNVTSSHPVSYHIEVKPTMNNCTATCSSDPECDLCLCTFRTIKLKEMHMKLVHEIAPEMVVSCGSINVAPKPNSRIKDDSIHFQCHLCPKQFKMKGSLRVHLRVVHSIGTKNEKTRINGQLNVKVDLSNEKIMNNLQNLPENKGLVLTALQAGGNLDTKLWECDVCAKSFTTKYFLKKHKRLHTGEMPYTCEVCGKTFTFQQSYHKHLLYHNDDKPHACSTCGRSFKELSTLHNHERIHSGEKPFKCETCDKCFRQRVSYLVHRRIHTGVMPYRCTACDKSFRYKVSQRTHKCDAQPPGTVVRQKSDLLSKLLQQSLGGTCTTNLNTENGSNEIPLEHSMDPSVDQSLDQSLDDLVAESCDKLGIVNGVDDVHVPSSPSEQFQHLCLYTPETQSLTDECNISIESINESAFKEFMFQSNL